LLVHICYYGLNIEHQFDTLKLRNGRDDVVAPQKPVVPLLGGPPAPSGPTSDPLTDRVLPRHIAIGGVPNTVEVRCRRSRTGDYCVVHHSGARTEPSSRKDSAHPSPSGPRSGEGAGQRWQRRPIDSTSTPSWSTSSRSMWGRDTRTSPSCESSRFSASTRLPGDDVAYAGASREDLWCILLRLFVSDACASCSLGWKALLPPSVFAASGP